MSEQSGGYRRSGPGMIGAMIVTVLAVAAFIGFRGLFREDLEVHPDPVEYLVGVETAQAAEFAVPYPPDLPEGWRATSIQLSASTPKKWSVGFLTDAEQFVGVRYEEETVDDLVEQYVDEKAVEGDTVPGRLCGDWQAWTDEGGDSAYTCTLKGTALIVYGSDADAVEQLRDRLTIAPLADSSASPSDSPSS